MLTAIRFARLRSVVLTEESLTPFGREGQPLPKQQVNAWT